MKSYTKINTICSDITNQELTISLHSDQLNLSENAIIDNVGGYVDIPEDSYYLKTNTNIFHLDGIVESSHLFTAIINSDSSKFVSQNELYNLKDNKQIQFIQKINLQENNTTTNILDVKFNPEQITTEYQKCQSKDTITTTDTSTSIIFPILFILIGLYLFVRSKK